MRAAEKAFVRFLEGSDKRFIIPIYQRNYDWKKEHCEQLFNDVIDIINSDFRNHFMGTIVSIYYEEGGLRYLIIDGQQRITTISLLLLAIYNLLQKGEIIASFKKEQIKDEYLINKYLEDDNKKIRLKPIESDNKAYLALFENSKYEIIEKSNITENYKFFCRKLKETDKSIDEIFNAIKKLFIVEIELKRNEDKPQLIFESINSTGLSLTQADLVRNFILMELTDEEQIKFYHRYWNKIEKNTGYEVSDFIRNYLTLKERMIPNKDRVYSSFKKYVINNNITTEKLLKDLLEYSIYYSKIAFSKDPNTKINNILKKINTLNITVSYPFLLEIYKDFEENIIDERKLIEILSLIESFSFRRLICDVPTNALNKIYMTLGREIKNHEDFRENYVEILKYLLIKRKYSQRFPDNNEFSEKFMTKDIYNLKNNAYLLGTMENFNHREKVDVENLLESNELTIEHIMPKKLSEEWKRNIGKDWEKIHEKYLNTIGNLTLTGYNKEMSNKSFQQKKTMENGFAESKLFLNEYLKEINSWNETTIEERANILKDNALKIWIYPHTRYVSKKDQPLFYNLTDEHNFTGEKIASFIFQDEETNVSSWKNFYEIVAKQLHRKDSFLFNSFIDDSDFITNKNKRHISESENELRSAIKIDDSLFLESNLGAEYILENIRKMLKKFGMNDDEIIIKLASFN